MSQTVEYINRLRALEGGDLSILRRCAGQPLNRSLAGFDIFTGLWWPLRAKGPATPRREPSWLVAKLFGSFRIPNAAADPTAASSLPAVLGRLEPQDGNRFRARFDALLSVKLASLEPHLRWALGEVARAMAKDAPGVVGIDWAQLLDHLSIWDRGEAHRLRRDIRGLWAENYLQSLRSKN